MRNVNAWRTVYDFMELVREERIILKAYINDDEYCFPQLARVFSSKPDPANNKRWFEKYGSIPDFHHYKSHEYGTKDNPIEFFVSCSTYLKEEGELND